MRSNNIFQSKLHNKILLMMMLVGVVPLLASGVLSLYSINVSHRLNVAEIEDVLLRGTAEELSSFISGVAGIFGLQVSFEQTSDIERESQNFILDQMLKEHADLEEVSFISLQGIETARKNRFYPVGVLAEDLRNESGAEKFLTARLGRNYLGPVHFTLRGPIMTIAAPVKNKNGIVISVLSGELNLRGIAEIIDRARLGNNGYLYLTERDGFTIAKSDTSALHENLNLAPLVSDILSGKNYLGPEGQMRYDSVFGGKVVGAGLYFPELSWALIAEWPVADADAILNTLSRQTVLFSFAVFLATIAFSVFLARQIVNPIRVLESGAKQVAEGKFETRVTIKTGDEIEELGDAFNEMTQGLKQLQELKDEFVFIAAHELKTPVAAIKGYLSLVLDGFAGPVSDQIKEFIGKVMNANTRLIRLVEDLLEVARSEAGRLEIAGSPTDAREPIRVTLEELKPLLEEKGIVVSYEAGDIPLALADSTRLREVMINLIGNAIKYSPKGGKIFVTHEVSGRELITRIKDTGYGISPEARKKLFGKFYRVQTSVTKDIPGTGLGLFIVKQIVEKMSGRIWVESREGEGST